MKQGEGPHSTEVPKTPRGLFAAGVAVGVSVAGPIGALVAHRLEEETIRFVLSNGLSAGALLALVVVTVFAREKDKRAQQVADECAKRERDDRDAHATKIESLFRDQLKIIPANTRVMERIEHVLDGDTP